MLSLILPTYKEAAGLPHLLPMLEKALQGVDAEVIIVDDDSPDRTWEVARKLSVTRPWLRVIRRVGRRGLSSAVIEGFLAAKGDVFVVADADGQHDLSLIPRLAEAVRAGSGIAIGSRYVEGGSVGQWDERRHTLSRIATWLAIKLCRVKVSDPMSGFFAIDRRIFEKALPTLNPKGFKILLDLLIHVPKGTKVAELPFTFGIREHGESKLSRRVQIEFLEYLYDSSLGNWIPLTFLKYAMVGLIGVAVNLGVYLLVSRFLVPEADAQLLGVSPAYLLGIEAAIIMNFLLNNAWTFAQARLRGIYAVIGFLRYNIACAFGALATLAITSALYRSGFGAISSVFVGAFVGMIWNYTMSRVFTWRV